MPEAAVNEDYFSASPKYEIGCAGQTPVVQTITKPKGMKEPAHDFFRFGVTMTDARHQLASFAPCQGIDHRFLIVMDWPPRQ